MKIFRVLLGFSSVLFLAMAGWLLIMRKKSENWPSAKGHLDSAYIEYLGSGSLGKGAGRTIPVPILRYSYAVNGKTYAGSAMSLWDVPVGMKAGKAQPISPPTTSGEIPVFYDPSRPGDAVLATGIPIDALAGFLFAAIACGLLFFAMPYFARWLYSDYLTEQ